MVSTSVSPASTQPWGGRDVKGKSSNRLVAGIRRRSVPHLLLGIVLIVACATGGVVASMQLGHRVTILALARPVTAGQVLSAQDCRRIDISTDTGMDLVPVEQASTVIGHPVAYTLPAGTMITRSLLGAPQIPIPGKAIAAIGLKSGQFPPDLAPGTTVLVLTVPSSSASSGMGSGTSWQAVVTGITRHDSDQITVVSLQLDQPDARAVATTPAGQLSVVAIPGGGR